MPTGATAAPAHSAERRFISVLFVDLVGFTPFAEERDPESVRETLDRYFAIARLAVERHGGTIEKFIGDAVMAVWGTPMAHEDDAERAMRAALELIDGVRELGPGIEARGAVLSGEAAVTLGAEGQAMVAGDLVNTASRLQAVAPAGTVLANDVAMRAASASIAFEPAGQHALQGKATPVEAYRALRVVAQRRGQNRAEGLEPPFVGREEELRLLKELLHATSRDRRVRLVSISGPAGIGKSRLAWELEKYIDGVVELVYMHRGRSPAYGEGITFWALGEMIRRRAGLAENDDEATSRERLTATVAEFVPDAADRRWVEPALLALLGLEAPPAGGREALFAAWRIFFERVAERSTCVLLFEDIQWADSGVLDFIHHVLEWSKNVPILVIVLARPEFFEQHPDWGAGHRLMSAIPLEPLPDEQMRALLAGLVPGLPETTVGTILGRADGIPLYAVETVRMLIAEGRLEAIDGGYRPVGDLTELAIPETLRSLIASRLDALDAADRSLLQDGSVLGQRFTVPALSAVSGLPADEIEPRLRALTRRELLALEADPRSPERGQYGFVQSLIREIAHGTLARRERRARHLAAARHFEALGDEELAGALATHYVAAYQASADGAEAEAVSVQARLALRAAADRAADLGAHAQAVSYIEQALKLTGEPAERAALLERAADSANADSRHEAAERYAREAIDEHVASKRPGEAAGAAALLGRILIDAGELNRAIEVMEQALTGEAAARSEAESAALLANLSRAFMRSSQPARSIEVADRALAIAERADLDEVVAEALINKGSSLVSLGRRREALALHQMAVDIAHERGLIELELRGRNNLSVGLLDDQPKRALETVLVSLELARKVGQKSIYVWQVGTVCLYARQLGDDWEAALALLEEALSGTVPRHDRARLLGFAALYRVARGEDPSAVVAEVEAVALGVTEPQAIATLEWNHAEAGLLTGRLDEAYRAALRAVEQWENYGDVCLPVALRAGLWHGRVGQVREVRDRLDRELRGGAWMAATRGWASAAVDALDGRAQDALAGFSQAVEMYGRIGMNWPKACAVLDAVKLLPAEFVPPQWSDEARQILERLAAAPYLAMLDEALRDGHDAVTAGQAVGLDGDSAGPTVQAEVTS
jgi:class 3 adenylate cyclase/predicted ATPase